MRILLGEHGLVGWVALEVVAVLASSAGLLEVLLLDGEFALALGKKLLLADESEPCLLCLPDLVRADGREERVEVFIEVLWVDPQIPVEEEEQLLLHEVDLGDGESKVFVAADAGVASPVLVLW